MQWVLDTIVTPVTTVKDTRWVGIGKDPSLTEVSRMDQDLLVGN